MTIRTRNDHRHTPLRWLAYRLNAAVLLAILLPSAVAVAQDGGTMMRIERLQIEHRDPSSVREALVPLLSGQESIGVIGDWLVVAATDGTRNRIRERLDGLDTPIRRLDLTLSLTIPAETGDADTDAESVAEPDTSDRELTLEPGQTVTLDLPASFAATDDAVNEEEAAPQISLRVVVENRQMYLEYAFHPADEPVTPATGTRTALQSDDWQALTDVIDIRVRPQF